ncbi:MAG TPA: hypothetical protein VFR67_06060 [Pilimelia sp.]|nr:hypothetical protein [Pilimelia sp.]
MTPPVTPRRYMVATADPVPVDEPTTGPRWTPPPAHLTLPTLPLTAGVVGLPRDGDR